MKMVQAILLIIASGHISFAVAGVDPFKPAGSFDLGGDDKWLKEAEDLAKEVKDMDGGKPKMGDDFDADKILAELKATDEQFSKPDSDPTSDLGSVAAGLEKGTMSSIADAINDGANGGDLNLPELTTVSYENDPMHKNDPLKDPNADKVLHELGMTDEEIEKMRNEPREETTVDVAIRECYGETHEQGCTNDQSPIRCLATAVRQKAADISEKCRRSTERALPYACSVELFVTHCDGVEMPLIQCLDKNHPKLGPECLDFLVITKKVMKTLKKKPKPIVKKEEESSLPSVLMLIGAVLAIGVALYLYKGGSFADIVYQLQIKQLKKLVLADNPYKKGGNDWTSNVDEDKDDKVVKLGNFGGSSYGGIS